MDEIDGDSPCLFSIVVGILFNGDDVVLYSGSCTSLQRLLNKPYEFCIVSSLEVNLPKTKIIIYGCNKRKLKQKAFYIDKGSIEITNEYKYLGIEFYSHEYSEPVKGEESQV